MTPFFLLLFACGYSTFRSDMILPTVSGNSDPYFACKNLAAMVDQSPGVDLLALAPPFFEQDHPMPVEAGATAEPAALAFDLASSESVGRHNWSTFCPAAGFADDLRVFKADGDLYSRMSRHEIERYRGHACSASLSFQSFHGLFLLVGLVSCLVLVCPWIIAGLLWWCRRARDSGQSQELGRGITAPRSYHYREVAVATGNFAESWRIGRGGFGAVYRGFLSDAGGRGVAVKVLSPESTEQGRREFEAEVRIIGRLRHRNLVQLLGWCDCRRGLFLVYELILEGSLDKHLHSPDRLLTWSERYMIALDLGSAILYLHTEWEQCVVHGDIKPSNVMLDSSRRAKLGDFGMARLVDHGAEPRTTQVVAGTIGYVDPEFVNNRRPCTESDVYSFGVVLLEIASGRQPAAASSEQPGQAPALLRRVRDAYSRDRILDAADGRLNGEFDRGQMERVLVTGLWCAHRDPSQRPSIVQAMAALRCEGSGMPVMPDLDGAGRIRDLEEQAYRDLSDEAASPSTRSSDATAYHTPEDSSSETEE
ncbi:unnamed protein product [Urochloa humidicola]